MSEHLRAQWRAATMARPSPDPVEYRHNPPRDPYAGPGDRPSGYHSIHAYLGGREIGWLTWFDPGDNEVTRLNPGYAERYTKVKVVEVAFDYRRQGIATEMLRRALAITPGIRHSDELTSDGRQWRDGASPEQAGTPFRPAMPMGNRLGAKATPSTLYHYTSEMHLPAILSDGGLRLTESNIDFMGNGPGVVWLTDTASGDGNGVYGFKSQVRITVRPGSRTFWWPEWSREQGIEDFWYESLDTASGGGPGAGEHWWVSTAQIPRRDFLKVEVLRDGQWVEP